MKKLLIILFSALSLSGYAKENIALLEPRVGDGSTPVTAMEKNMVRGELRKAIVNFSGYDAITRADIDQIMNEQNFQRTGLVSDSQIKKLGEMFGADYICVSTLTKSNTEFYMEAYLIHVESGRMSNPASQYGELANGKLANMFPACKVLANELLSSHIPTGFVDLGLPSGTLWKNANENRQFSFEDAKKRYNSQLPTYAQWKELFQYCTIKWVDPGKWEKLPYAELIVHKGDNPYYLLTGVNGNTITLSADGFGTDWECVACGVLEYGVPESEGLVGFYYTSQGVGNKNFDFVVFDEHKYKILYTAEDREWVHNVIPYTDIYMNIRLVY